MLQSIVLIEDEQPIRVYTAKLLKQAGYQVYEAIDGITGLELLRAYATHLIICDIALPRLSGYGVLDAIRHDPRNQSLPFIFLTSRSTLTDQRQGIELGADDYLAKPFSATELLASVAARLIHLDALDFPLEIIPKFMGAPSSHWVFNHLIQPQLGDRFGGWYVAYEPNTGRSYLGQTQAAALAAANRAKPNQTFFCRQLTPTSAAPPSQNAELR